MVVFAFIDYRQQPFIGLLGHGGGSISTSGIGGALISVRLGLRSPTAFNAASAISKSIAMTAARLPNVHPRLTRARIMASAAS
jgi:hypothetical protein